MKQFLLSLAFLSWTADCFNPTAIVCALIPYTPYLGENLSYLWGKIVLQDADRYGFLIISPILILTEIITLKFYYDNPKIMGKPGMLFCVIIVFELLLNMHFFMSALYYTLVDGTLLMPSSFPVFCTVNSIISAFFQTLHIVFLLIIPLYIVYVLRSSLKSSSKIWNFVYVGIFIMSAIATYLMWYEGLLGLNIFGLCGVSFIRFPDMNIAIPIVFICFTAIFVIAGIFTIQYFKKHMPNSIGLRKKKRYQKHILVLYVTGYAAFGIAQSAITLTLYLNCNLAHPKPELLPLVTVFNYIHLIQCCYIYFIIFKPQNVRGAFKKFLRKMFSKNNSNSTFQRNVSMSQETSADPNLDEMFNFEQVLLQIQEENNNIDILKISQVVTIVSGIYIAYKQYYNIKQEYFNPFMYKLDPSQSVYSLNSPRKKVNFNKSTKNIYYHEKMSVKINIQIVKDFIHDRSLLPKFGILQCTMIIHSPKIFQHLLENDNLESIFQSFELQQNARKMFDLAEGQGGKSGEFFFYSADNKFVLKTITPDEFTFLDSNLLYFHQHFNRNQDSVLAKIYGLFTFKGDQMQRTYHLILMKNMLACNNSQICRTYDLKGSRYDREVNLGGIQANELQKMTLKDTDFMKQEGRINVSPQIKSKLQQAIIKDTLFLKNLNLIDYSLLVVKVKWSQPPKNPQFWGRYQRIPSCVSNDEYYHIGIIDYLQQWDLQKKGQKWWKVLMGKKDISAQEPKYYQNRFATFVGEITQGLGLREVPQNDGISDHDKDVYLFDRSNLEQGLIKLQRLERQGNCLKQKIEQMAKEDQENTEKLSLEPRQSKFVIEMSLSNNIGSSLTRKKQRYAQDQNGKLQSSYHQDQSQRSNVGSSILKEECIAKNHQDSYTQQPNL